MIVYLIHFTRPYHHAQHYLGTTSDLGRRLDQHLSERKHLFGAVNRARIPWMCVRTWEGGHALERQLKRRHDSRSLCPVCRSLAGLPSPALLPPPRPARATEEAEVVYGS